MVTSTSLWSLCSSPQVSPGINVMTGKISGFQASTQKRQRGKVTKIITNWGLTAFFFQKVKHVFFSHQRFFISNPTNAYPRKLENDNFWGAIFHYLGVIPTLELQKCSPNLTHPWGFVSIPTCIGSPKLGSPTLLGGFLVRWIHTPSEVGGQQQNGRIVG